MSETIVPSLPGNLSALLPNPGDARANVFKNQFLSAARRAPSKESPSSLTQPVASQINQLLKEKEGRSFVERKLSSDLVQVVAVKNANGEMSQVQRASAENAMSLIDEGKGGILVDIGTDDVGQLSRSIRHMGGTVESESTRYGSVRARVPAQNLMALAKLSHVERVDSAAIATTGMEPQPTNPTSPPVPTMPTSPTTPVPTMPVPTAPVVAEEMSGVAKVNTSEGLTAHRVNELQSEFGADGSGVTIGVISDSIRFLEERQATGDLPSDINILPGQSGIIEGGTDTGEGTAMLEIVHDLAPGAELVFATGFSGQEGMAENIRALREAGADIIVDDVGYFADSVFQDGIIAQAVNEVVNDGALYFSAAGNSGNLNDGTSGTYEADFKESSVEREFSVNGALHDFSNGAVATTITSFNNRLPITLKWNDPLGSSGNDYDLFAVLDGRVVASSTNVQDGDDDPIEEIGPQLIGTELFVVKKDDAEERVINIATNRAQLDISTDSTVYGQAAAENAIAVAAVNAALAEGGPFTGGDANPVETFSSDGPRRFFYDKDGVALTDDLSRSGGVVRQVPRIAAADGVSTATPGFDKFFGTSAAAPHAAAIAAVLASSNPDASNAEIVDALTSTALDIEAEGVDRDSGFGLIDARAAYDALQNV